MKIYKLEVNKVQEPSGAALSSYIAPRQLQKYYFYLDKLKAEKHRDEIYDGLQKLVGLFAGIEAIITEIEVIE